MVYHYPDFATYFTGKQILPNEIMIMIHDYCRAAFIKHARSLKLQRHTPKTIFESANGGYLDQAVNVGPYVMIFIYIEKQLMIKSVIRRSRRGSFLGNIIHSESFASSTRHASRFFSLAFRHLDVIVSAHY